MSPNSSLLSKICTKLTKSKKTYGYSVQQGQHQKAVIIHSARGDIPTARAVGATATANNRITGHKPGTNLQKLKTKSKFKLSAGYKLAQENTLAKQKK